MRGELPFSRKDLMESASIVRPRDCAVGEVCADLEREVSGAHQ